MLKTMRCGIWFRLLAALPLAAGGPSTAPNRQIIIDPWPAPTILTFDPRHPPQNMHLLENGDPGMADATAMIHWNSGKIRGKWDPGQHIMVVTDIEPVVITGHTEIRLPEDATEKLKEHELGHDTVYAAIWNQSAHKIADNVLRDMVGRHFSGEGADEAARQASAWGKAGDELCRRMNGVTDQIVQRMGVVSNRYDQITDHSRNPIESQAGAFQALKEQAELDKQTATRPAK